MKKTSDSEKVVKAVQTLLQPFLLPVGAGLPPQYLCSTNVVLGLSGGRDSMVLLEAWYRWCLTLPDALQQSFKSQTLVVHVNHQLQDESAQWSAFCAMQCAQRGFSFQSVTVDICSQVRQHKGEEQAAREARYQAFSQFIGTDDILLTAHHQRDQAETFLLNLMRGAGVSGLQGMPVQKVFGKGWHLRPFLSLSAAQIEVASKQWGLDWVEDPTNVQIDYRRNYLRHQVLPHLQQTWPAAVSKISQSAEWMQEAQTCLEDLAALDLSRCAQFTLTAEQAVPPFTQPFSSLSITSLATLSVARQKNLLRFWLRKVLNLTPNQSVIEWVWQQCQPQSSADRHPIYELKSQGQRIEVANQQVYVYAHETFKNKQVEEEPKRLADLEKDMRFQRASNSGEGACLNPVLLTYHQAQKTSAFRPSQRYKKWFQKHQIPVWQRANWPGFWWEGQFVLCGMAAYEMPNQVTSWPFYWPFFNS